MYPVVIPVTSGTFRVHSILTFLFPFTGETAILVFVTPR